MSSMITRAKHTLRFVVCFGFLAISACSHIRTNQIASPGPADTGLKHRHIFLTFMPENKKIPAHIIYRRKEHFFANKSYKNTPFVVAIDVNPTMRNPSIIAHVEKKGVKIREFVAEKNAPPVLNEKRSAWFPTKSKLSLVIPFLLDDEEVVVTTSYEWMDHRFLAPIFLEDHQPIKDASLTVDVPYGITPHFKAARNGQGYDFVPSDSLKEQALWIQEENRSGLGTRLVWQKKNEQESRRERLSDFLQIFLAFESPSRNNHAPRLNSWLSIATWLYDRIESYDMPSTEIREFVLRETQNLTSLDHKIARIIAFLNNEIEKRPISGPYYEQTIQAATITFARRLGSNFDKAILGKAMLSTLGVESELIAAADKAFNPNVTGEFFSPALFNSILLCISEPNKKRYYDPEYASHPTRGYRLRPNLQGQLGLLIKPQNGKLIPLPHDGAYMNGKTYSLQLELSEDGMLWGDYSIDLYGWDANPLITAEQNNMSLISPEVLEKKFQIANFGLPPQTAEIVVDKNSGLRASIFGEIKPKILIKNNDNNFHLRLDNIIQPVLSMLNESPKKEYSSITKLSLFINLAPNFFLKNLPPQINFHVDGIEGRFAASFSNGQLTLEGIAMVSLPIKTDITERLKPELNKMKWYIDENLVIANVESEIGVPSGDPSLFGDKAS